MKLKAQHDQTIIRNSNSRLPDEAKLREPSQTHFLHDSWERLLEVSSLIQYNRSHLSKWAKTLFLGG